MRNAMVVVFGALATLAAACGGSDNASNKFKGTWMYAAGTTTTTCPDLGGATTDQLTGNVTLTAAVGADLLWDDDFCSFRFNVSGSTASALPGQMCVQVTSDGTLTVTP